MITDRELKGLKATDKDIMLPDGNNLYIRVRKSGKKQFLYRSRSGGKATYTILGEYPPMSLSDARKAASTFVSPVTSITVDQVFDKFYAHISKYYANPKAVKSSYENNVKKILGNKPINSVSRSDVSTLLQSVVDRGAPIMANRLLTDLKILFGFAVEHGYIESNVLQALTKKYVGGKEKPRDRVLSRDELVELLRELLAPTLDVKTRVALYVILLTGQRASEVLGYSDKDVKGSWWHIPATVTGNKAGREQKVYLSPQARAVLKLCKPPFASAHQTLSKALKRRGYTYTPHDFRRTITTHLNNMGVMPHVTEKMLNHVMEGVMAVYNHAEYLPERKEAWRKWGVYIAGLRREARRPKE